MVVVVVVVGTVCPGDPARPEIFLSITAPGWTRVRCVHSSVTSLLSVLLFPPAEPGDWLDIVVTTAVGRREQEEPGAV